MLETPKRDRRSERREATKAEIVAAAWELCEAEGLAGLSLRDLARRVGMQAPSLYSYFASKHDIYDAMFAEGFRQFNAQRVLPTESTTLAGLQKMAHRFAEFCTSNPVRYQLMFQRTIPGFEPSQESYALAVEFLGRTAAVFEEVGFDGDDLDLYTALISGLTSQQISNDPGGDRWIRRVDEAVDMYLDHVFAKHAKHETKPTKRR